MLWVILLVPLMAIAMALPMVNIAKATPSTIYFSPEVIADENLVIGSYITIGIGIDYGMEIWGYQIELTFNPSVLKGVSVDDSGFLGMLGGTVIEAPGIGWDNVNGKLWLYGNALFEKDDALCPDGGGILVFVTFEVVGMGSSAVHTGWDTGVMNNTGGWIVHGGTPRGFFSNVALPELYVRTKGAHGSSGVWPEWVVGEAWTEQTLYCRVINLGAAATVRVTFRVRTIEGIETYISDEAYVPAYDGSSASEVVVSASFTAESPSVNHVSAFLEFKDDTMVDLIPYGLVDDYIGGIGVSRDTKVEFKVTD